MCGLEASWPLSPRRPPTPGVGGPRWLRTPWTGRTPEDGPAPFDLGRTARREQAEVGLERPVAAWSGVVPGAAEGGKRYLRCSVAGLTPGTVPTPVEATALGPQFPLDFPFSGRERALYGGREALRRPARRTPGLGGHHGARGRWTRAASSRVPARPGPGAGKRGLRTRPARRKEGEPRPPSAARTARLRGRRDAPASRPPGPRGCRRRSRAVLAEVAGGLKPEPRSPRVLPCLGWGATRVPSTPFLGSPGPRELVALKEGISIQEFLQLCSQS